MIRIGYKVLIPLISGLVTDAAEALGSTAVPQVLIPLISGLVTDRNTARQRPC